MFVCSYKIVVGGVPLCIVEMRSICIFAALVKTPHKIYSFAGPRFIHPSSVEPITNNVAFPTSSMAYTALAVVAIVSMTTCRGWDSSSSSSSSAYSRDVKKVKPMDRRLRGGNENKWQHDRNLLIGGLDVP